jgi:hypothetical protein
MNEKTRPVQWEKLMDLIEWAKLSDDNSERLKKGKPSEVAKIIKEEAQMSMEEVALLFDDLGYIADRNSLQWWSPLA